MDNRFLKIEEFKGKAFDLAITFGSGLPKITLPIGQTAHINRLLGQNWQIGSSIRLAMNEIGVWIEFIFEKDEKEKPAFRTEGRLIGIDRGYRKASVTSDGQQIGAALKDQIRPKCKRSRLPYHHIITELLSRGIVIYARRS